MTMNSTISELVQDNSNVTTETNPMDTVQNSDLVFGQKHNDIDCALCPTAKRACDRAWCTAKNLEEWSGMSKMTLWRWLERIEKARRISLVSDMIPVNVPTATGAKSTTFYNLNVLNQLAMACIDDEIILGNFKGNDSLPLANRGNTFVSLRGVLEILSKTELSSDIVDNFQDEVFGHLLPSLALTGRTEVDSLSQTSRDLPDIPRQRAVAHERLRCAPVSPMGVRHSGQNVRRRQHVSG